jgi:hypothetical protein
MQLFLGRSGVGEISFARQLTANAQRLANGQALAIRKGERVPRQDAIILATRFQMAPPPFPYSIEDPRVLLVHFSRVSLLQFTKPSDKRFHF